MLFIQVQYTLVTEEAERIGVDHVARLSSAGHSEVSQGLYIYSYIFMSIACPLYHSLQTQE